MEQQHQHHQQQRAHLHMHSSPPNSFTPRKEFAKQSTQSSSFSLLTFSASSLIRLYSFPPPVVSALRRYLDDRRFVAAYREDVNNNYCEFTLQGKPWNSPKSIATERLVTNVLAIILQCGYGLLSTLDYGREQDDRICIAFSKPLTTQSGSNGSAHSHSPMPTRVAAKQSTSTLPLNFTVPFAVSFASATILRVISPPLHSTPAILGAVRGSWPRGVVSEKKIGESCYEFKLKGYRWFQEDTFATDSLRHILTLLEALDSHSFTLMTSLSLSNHSRVKDLWIFSGVSDEQHQDLRMSATTDLELPDSPPASPLMGSPTQRPRSPLFATTFPEGLPAEHQKMATMPTPQVTTSNHSRSATEGHIPRSTSPLRHEGTVLRKPAPRAQIPVSIAETLPLSPPQNNEGGRAVLPSTIEGSINMTGVGANAEAVLGTHRDLQLPPHIPEPEVIYTAGPARNIAPIQIIAPTPVLAGRSESPLRRSSPEFPKRLAVNIANSPPVSQYLEAPIHADSPASSPKHWTPPTDQPRTPSPPPSSPTPPTPPTLPAEDPITPTSSTLLGPSAFRNTTIDGTESNIPEGFRDSAFTTGSDWKSFEIPIKWTGPGTEPKRVQPSPGPSLPGAWAPSPVVEEHPDEEVDAFEGGYRSKEATPEQQDPEVQTRLPELVEGAGRQSEAGILGVITPKSEEGDKLDKPDKQKEREKEKPNKLKRASEGWVVVNIEGQQAADASGSDSQKPRQPSGSSTAHTRSGSAIQFPSPGDPKVNGSIGVPDGPVQASAPAKSIAIIDPVPPAKHKRASGSSPNTTPSPPAFKRLLSFSRKEPKEKVAEDKPKDKEKVGFRQRFRRLGSKSASE